MTTLLLKFDLRMEQRDQETPNGPGPRFYRWLPDGEADALTLPSDARIRVWFKRRGFMKDSHPNGPWIEYSHDRFEIDPAVLDLQAPLIAGPLEGTVELENIPDEQAQALVDNHEGEAYISLAKRVVQKILYPPLSKFMEVLHYAYGQHWIPLLEPYDSRKWNLVSYCSFLNLCWKLDPADQWHRFNPGSFGIDTFHVPAPPARQFDQLLTREDWARMEALIGRYAPPLASKLVARVLVSRDNYRLREAIIDVQTALEVAVNAFVKRSIPDDTHGTLSGQLRRNVVQALTENPPPNVSQAGQALLAEEIAKGMKAARGLTDKYSLEDKVTLVSAAVTGITTAERDQVLHIIKIRNAIIHDGHMPEATGGLWKDIDTTLRLIAALLEDIPQKRPSLELGGRRVTSPAQWNPPEGK